MDSRFRENDGQGFAERFTFPVILAKAGIHLEQCAKNIVNVSTETEV